MEYIKTEIEIGLLNPVIDLLDNNGVHSIIYKTEEIEVITKDMIKKLSELLSGKRKILCTNAGIDLHSSEKEYLDVVCLKVSYKHIEDVMLGLDTLCG